MKGTVRQPVATSSRWLVCSYFKSECTGGPAPYDDIFDRLLRESSSAMSSPPEAEAVEVEIDDRGGVERQQLAEDQAADDGDAERLGGTP